MSLNTTGDIYTEVLVRNNRTTTDGFITDTMLQDWLRQAHVWASSFHKWPMTEVRDKTVAFSGTEEVPYSSFSVSYKADSIRLLQVDGKRFQKLNFEDYQILRENRPDATDRVYSDYDRILFINPTADASGTITAWGQYQPTIDPTDPAATTVFSTRDEEGNEALVERMTGYLKRREHLPDEAELHDTRAKDKLNEVWARIQGEQFNYHTSKDRDGMFARFDVLNGTSEDFDRDQFII